MGGLSRPRRVPWWPAPQSGKRGALCGDDRPGCYPCYSKTEAAAGVEVQGFNRRKATRRNVPADLPRRRVVHPAPTTCPCCGGSNLSKLGEDVTETLDVVPRQWFVTEHVREKFSCRSCETI